MKVMWNFEIKERIHVQRIKMPKNAELQWIRYAKGQYRIYAIVDPDLKKETRNFICINGGEEIPEDHKIVDTFVCNTTPFHVFEILG